MRAAAFVRQMPDGANPFAWSSEALFPLSTTICRVDDSHPSDFLAH